MGLIKKESIGKMLWQHNYFTSFGAAIFHSETVQESLKNVQITYFFRN